MPQGPDFVAQLPPLGQLIFYALIGIGALAAGWRAYTAERKKQAPASTTDVVLAGGTIADMKPVRDMGESIDRLTGEVARLANASEAILEIMKEEADERDIEREVERRMREERGERIPEPRRRRS
ncbi:hypothetical protein [Terrarubrum flagellatum]|uniref:hypothetical protein n=1 Tax=Terrirubrum flagellatum TaxID=2895980 RepID=UPI0031450DCB